MRTGSAGMTVISLALLVLTACSNAANPAGLTPITGGLTSAASVTGEPTSAAPGDGGTRVEVSENEYSITVRRTDFTPGTYTFVVDNAGQTGHDLDIRGPGVETAKIMPVGSQADVIVTLQPGTYELWCSISNHRVRGMHRTVTVAG